MKFCSNCLNPILKKDLNTINLIAAEYQKDSIPWYLGFSGGKDSTALLVLVMNALKQVQSYHKPVTVVYCDTGVEIPTITAYVHSTILRLAIECVEHSLPIKFEIVKPKINDRFFVKVIGRGYPPPTNIFRWCTDRLRINPVKSVINSDDTAMVLLGVRRGESQERDRTIARHDTQNQYYLNQKKSSKAKIFSPMINYSLKDVWATIKFARFPTSIDYNKLGELYKDAGAECPVYRESKGTPCGKGRFGCWTCTVVRKDKSVASMVKNGYEELLPLHNFRNWLAEFRNDTEYRCKYRRNGQSGLGPFTLIGRERILTELLKAQEESGLQLLSEEEILAIEALWQKDKNCLNYIENRASP